MTPGTFVAGEAASVAPLGGAYYRAMYLPPNGASNAAFLETLRLLLVHETRGPAHRRSQLAYATPRAWLAAGQADRRRSAADELRPGLVHAGGAARASCRRRSTCPSGALGTLELRLRLPRGEAYRGGDAAGGPAVPPCRRRRPSTSRAAGHGSTSLVQAAERDRTRVLASCIDGRGGGDRREDASGSRRPLPRARRPHRAGIRLCCRPGTGKTNNPPIPLVISPHGRGVSARANANWGGLPARGMFAVISPDGAGASWSRYSWGSAGQIETSRGCRRSLRHAAVAPDRRAPDLRASAAAWAARRRCSCSRRHPRLLAGAAAFDAVADFALQYRSFRRISVRQRLPKTWDGPVGRSLQSLARTGGRRHRRGRGRARTPCAAR